MEEEEAGLELKKIEYELDGCGNFTNRPVTQVIWDEKGGYAEMLLPFTVVIYNKDENAFVGWKFVRQRTTKNKDGRFVPVDTFERCTIRYVREYRPWTVKMVGKK